MSTMLDRGFNGHDQRAGGTPKTSEGRLMPTIEKTLRILGHFFSGIGNWFDARAEKRFLARMARDWPNGTRVRLVCDCEDMRGDHEGEWEVDGYDRDAGDYRLLRPSTTTVFSNNTTWAPAGHFQRTD